MIFPLTDHDKRKIPTEKYFSDQTDVQQGGQEQGREADAGGMEAGVELLRCSDNNVTNLPPTLLRKFYLIFCRQEVDEFFQRMDRDYDGRLSFEEFMGEESNIEKLFKNMDKNGDGFVTKQV